MLDVAGGIWAGGRVEYGSIFHLKTDTTKTIL